MWEIIADNYSLHLKSLQHDPKDALSFGNPARDIIVKWLVEDVSVCVMDEGM